MTNRGLIIYHKWGDNYIAMLDRKFCHSRHFQNSLGTEYMIQRGSARVWPHDIHWQEFCTNSLGKTGDYYTSSQASHQAGNPPGTYLDYTFLCKDCSLGQDRIVCRAVYKTSWSWRNHASPSPVIATAVYNENNNWIYKTTRCMFSILFFINYVFILCHHQRCAKDGEEMKGEPTSSTFEAKMPIKE